MANAYDEKEIFNEKAKTWNEQPGKLEEAKTFIEKIKSKISLDKDMRVLDFGCGTGLNGLELINTVKTVAFLDISDGMISQLQTRLNQLNATNYEIYNKLIDEIGDVEPFDVIMTTLTFHHTADVEGTVRSFFKLLKSGGKVFVVDLFKCEGKSHSEHKTMPHHDGFETDELKKIFGDAGFSRCDVESYGFKKFPRDLTKDFEMFFLTAEK